MRTLVAATIILLFVFLASGCEEGFKVTFRNSTDQVVTIWQGNAKLNDLPPGSEVAESIKYFTGATTFRATGPDGQVLYQEAFTYGELDAQGQIVIPRPDS